MRRIFSRIAIAAFFMPLAGLSAGAAEIHVLAPTSIVFGLQSLAKSFTQETGTVVDFSFGNAGTIPGKLDSAMPADVVVLPPDDMDAVEKKGALKAGTKTDLGRDKIGYIVKAGMPHPDISTPEKFRAALLVANLVIYNDPASGSAGGAVVGNILKDPAFAGVKPLLLHNVFPVQILTLQGNQIVLEPLSEVAPVPGFDVVGTIPAPWPGYVDFAVAIPAKSTASDAGLAFLHYITRPEAAAVWKSAGLDR
jgi:molybdate transport system substrate-binding protein